MKRLYTRLIAIVLTVTMLSGTAVPAFATEMKSGIGVVTASSLLLRSAASSSSEVLDTAYAGDSVVIIRESGDWYLVSYNLQVGYMHKDYVEFNDRKNVKIGYAMFDCTSNVREAPDTSSDVVAQAPKDDTCFIIGFNCGWFKVSFNGQIGYVRSDLVTMLESPYANTGSKGNTYKESTKRTAASDSSAADTVTAAPAASATPKAAPAATSASAAKPAASNALGDRICAYAQQFLGYSYVYGGASPAAGFDCSGLVYYVYKHFGYTIGRTAADQLYSGTQVSRSNLQPGDIVLFERTYSSSSRATHAGIYIGNGNFIHAANSRTGVVITSRSNEYYSSRLICGVRVG